MDIVSKWRCTGKNMMLSEIMQTGDDLAAEIESLRTENATLREEVARKTKLAENYEVLAVEFGASNLQLCAENDKLKLSS